MPSTEHPGYQPKPPLRPLTAQNHAQLSFPQLRALYGYLSPAPPSPERDPAENGPQGEPQRSEGTPLLDLLP